MPETERRGDATNENDPRERFLRSGIPGQIA